MATSLNGWPELKAGDPRLAHGVIPGTHKSLTEHSEFLPLALAVAADVNKKIIPLDPGPVGGWVDRMARTGAGLSDHASGTAMDLRWDVFKADHLRHMTPAQLTAAHAILDKYRTPKGKRVLGFGGDWTVGTYCDEMHWEVGQAWQPGVKTPVTIADIRAVIAHLGIKPNGTQGVVPAAPLHPVAKVIAKIPVVKKIVVKPVPKPAPKHVKPPVFVGVLRLGGRGAQVRILQVRLGVKPGAVAVFGPSTRTAVLAFQRRHGLKATGVVDRVTWVALFGK